MSLSLQSIAHALGGRVVQGSKAHVAAPFPGKKRHDRSLHVFINGDDIGIHLFRDGVDPIAIKDHVRRVCGLPMWKTKQKKPKPKSDVSFSTRNHFFGETLAVCRFRRQIGGPMFALLLNDLRLRGDTKDAIKYAREFGLTEDDLEPCMNETPRHYTADERAEILNLTYAERQHLGLRRTGSVDVDKAGRERARRDRYNAKRRAVRASARASGVNKNSPVEGRPEESKEEVIRKESFVKKKPPLVFTRGTIVPKSLRRGTLFVRSGRAAVPVRSNFGHSRAMARGSPPAPRIQHKIFRYDPGNPHYEMIA